MGRTYILETEQRLPRPLEAVFAFFADAANLQALTPPWLDFKIVTPLPIEMRAGTLIDYRLKLRRFPIKWQTHIAHWEPNREFVDEQLRGPYRRWIHRHTFEPVAGGTMVRDRVEYAVPGGALAHRLFVRRDVQRIFTYRSQRLAEIFGTQDTGRQWLYVETGDRAAA